MRKTSFISGGNSNPPMNTIDHNADQNSDSPYLQKTDNNNNFQYKDVYIQENSYQNRA